MPSFYVYILECVDKKKRKSYYTGYTQDLKKRFELHRSGKGAKYTKGKDLTLMHTEYFSTRSEAMHRELEIKKMSKKQKKGLIKQGVRI
jgi:putative endonuclease